MGDLVKTLHNFLLYPYVWQGLVSSLFTLGLVWFLVRVLGLKEAGTRAWIFLLPMLAPLLLPFKAGNQLHWWLLHAIQTQIWAHGFNGWLVVCFLPFIVMFLQGAISYLAYRWLLWGSKAVAADDAPQLFSMLEDLAQQARVSLPRVCLLPPGREAHIFVCGTWRPCLALSPELLTSLPEPELRAVLAHEVAHLARRDQVISWVASLLRSLMFYNPVLYLLEGWVRKEREKAADLLAATWTGQPRALASGLLGVTKLALNRRRDLTWCLPATELTSGGLLSERVQLLLDVDRLKNQDTPWRLWLFCALFLGLETFYAYWMFLPLGRHVPCILMLFH
jgi:Zn-dependent protease with chaperone function